MGQGKRPQTEVRSRVGDTPEHVLDRMDHLMHHLLAEVELLSVPVPVPTMSSRWSELSVVLVLQAMSHVRLLLVLPLENVRLGEQEARHSNHSAEDQEHLQPALPGDDLILNGHVPDVHEHLDERIEEGRRRLFPHDATCGRRLAVFGVKDRGIDESVVAEHVGFHNQPVLPLEHSTTSSGRVALHAPHVAWELRQARDSTAARVEGRSPARRVAQILHAVSLRDGYDKLVVDHESCVPVGGPLGEDQDAEIAENRIDEHHLWDVNPIQGDPVLKVERVHELRANSGNHLNNSGNDRKLHLERVRRIQLVRCVCPSRVGTEGIRFPGNLGSGGNTMRVCLIDVGPQPLLRLLGCVSAWNTCASLVVCHLTRAPCSRSPDFQGNSKQFIVDKSRVCCEDTHEKDVVSTLVHSSKHFVLGKVCKLLLIQNQKQTAQCHDKTMANITEHHTEQEREGNE
mmetsp:Transcript_31718/g.71326  ORF Transcript_31718/g.71326 Transcript_31718/m.71326 type:complete len:456 (-) Transcript_31718:1339-2706(-)